MAICRDMATVIASANPDNNTALGGHLTQHIYRMRPPAGLSQAGKTLFSGRDKFEAAWRQYRYHPNARNCSGSGQAQQSVDLHTLGMRWLDAYSCTAANGEGECTAYTLYMAESV